jgi:glycosyltransferase involved in cell wall biosynthesis
MNNSDLHILHISNSYGGTEVYSNLILSLDRLGVRQTVFVPLNPNNHNRIGSQLLSFSVPDSTIIYSTTLKWYHRYLYMNKIIKIMEEITNSIDINNISIIHAGLFCSDGAVAYEINKRFNIPYIVAVKNTDVNIYYKKMFWKRRYFLKILKKSRNVIFLSPQYKQTFLKIISNKNKMLLDSKSIIMPNGIDSFYLKNRINFIKKINSPVHFVFAGAFNRGKNIDKVISALDILNQKGRQVHFSIIGKGLKYRNEEGDYVNKIYELASKREWIEILESKEKEELKMIFENSDIFIMPSMPETFGLVYVEALSQGLPIIYANGQGFDGYYNDKNIGYGVNPSDTNDIVEKLESLINNYDNVSFNISQLKLNEDFSWENISENYLQLYKKICN